MPAQRIVVLDQGSEIAFSLSDMLAYHGRSSPGGVAHAFKVLERALALLEPGGGVERREIVIATAFGGPGARDAFELVTRAVTEQRYEIDRSLERPELGRTRERFVFRLSYRGRVVTLSLRAGFVTDEFIELARREDPSSEDQRRLTALKQEMAARVMAAPAAAVYEELDGAPD